ncbi:MAG: hypothetical protein V1816_16560 [Pseudomonadota bacterium]
MTLEQPGLKKETPASQVRRGAGRGESRSPSEGKKTAAKAGMILSLAALAVTGLMFGRGARVLHLWSGMALVGFSFRHYNLYRRPSRGK